MAEYNDSSKISVSDYASDCKRGLGLTRDRIKKRFNRILDSKYIPAYLSSKAETYSSNPKKKAKKILPAITGLAGAATGFLGSAFYLDEMHRRLNFPSSSDAYRALNLWDKYMYQIVKVDSPYWPLFIAVSTAAGAIAGWGVGKIVEKKLFKEKVSKE
jgi:hypothetical protein